METGYYVTNILTQWNICVFDQEKRIGYPVLTLLVKSVKSHFAILT